MKDSFKKLISVLLCLLVLAGSVSAVATASTDSPYPDGVTPEQAQAAVSGTDKLINAVLPTMMGTDLHTALTQRIYTNAAVSSTLVSIYSALSEQGDTLSYIGLDASPKGVSAYLGAYPKIAGMLYACDSWEQVDLINADWGVTDKVTFARTLANCFNPFNDILYTLLCSGTFEINRFIKIEGADGYSNAIVPMLKSLKCGDILSSADFKLQADRNRASMIENIILPVLTTVENSLSQPMDSFTDILPSFADFAVNGDFDACVEKLLEPVTGNPLVEIATLLKIFDLPSFDLDLEQMLNDMLSGEGTDGAFKAAPIDMKSLAACGSKNGDVFVADKGRAYVVIMRWLVDTIKLNGGSLNAIGGGVDTTFITELLKKDTDAIVKTAIMLFAPTTIGEAQAMVYPAVTPKSVAYTPNLTQKDYEKALKEIDDLLDEFVKEGGTANKMGEVIASMVYTPDNVNAIVKALYVELDKNGLVEMLKMLGVDASPKGVASMLTDGKHASAVKLLTQYESWADVPFNKLDWGFSYGSRKGFQGALTSSLRPLFPLLRMLLAGEDIVLLDSITIKGADGYNTAVIPLLEGLGCKPYYIKSYDSYKKNASGDGVIDNVLDPALNLIDEICMKPVYGITEALPNLVYFVNSGSVEKCIANLMLPVTALTDKFSGVIDVNMDASAFNMKIDINSLLESMLSTTGMKMAKLDVNALASLGTPVQRQSKSLINGKASNYTYIDSDNTAVFITLLRFLAETIKMPGNEDLLTGLMAGGGDAGMYGGYSAQLSEQFASMSVDELIEWLYNLLFKERVKIQIVVKDDYKPTIIFEEGKADPRWVYGLATYLGICLVVGAIIFFNRKRLYN